MNFNVFSFDNFDDCTQIVIKHAAEYRKLLPLPCTWYVDNMIARRDSHGVNARVWMTTVYPKKYAHGFCFAVLCCGYTLTEFPISIRLTSLALWQSNDCPSANKATLMNMDKYFMWIHYERLHNHNKAKHNKTVCILLGIYCSSLQLIRRHPVMAELHYRLTNYICATQCTGNTTTILLPTKKSQKKSLTYWGRDKKAAIFQTTLLNEFFEWKCVNFD